MPAQPTAAGEPFPSGGGPDRLPVLGLTSQYPQAGANSQAAFNRQQMAALANHCRLALVAPVFCTAARGLLGRSQPAPAPFPLARPIFWYTPGFKRDWHGRLYLLSVWPALRRLAARLGPRVLLATWLYPDAWAGLMAARRLGLPLVVKLHGSDLLVLRQDPARLPFLRQTLMGARAVVAVSRPLAQAARELGADPDKVWVVPNGVDREMFTPGNRDAARRALGLPQQGPLLLFVGRLEEVKGPQVLLESLAGLPGVTLVVVGGGSLEKKLRARAARPDLAGRVIWAGAQPHARVPAYLAACSGLALPSLSEGEPNAVLEALAAGRPVAASAVGGVPDLVAEGRQGCLCPPGQAPALTQALKRLLATDWDSAALRASVAGRGWQESAGRLARVLAWAAGEGARP